MLSKSRPEVKRFNCFPPSMRACKWTTLRTRRRLITSNMVNLWQMNKVGLKAERFFGAEKLNADAAALITGISVTGDSPGP